MLFRSEATLLHTSGFGINGGIQSLKQWKDSSIFAELCGFGSFFLHIPGLDMDGQLQMYEIIRELLLEKRISNRWILQKYPAHYANAYKWNAGSDELNKQEF